MSSARGPQEVPSGPADPSAPDGRGARLESAAGRPDRAAGRPDGAHPGVRQQLARGDAIDRLFVVGILIKALDGLLEVLGGAVLLLSTPDQLTGWVSRLVSGELAEDPHDLIATWLLHWSAHSLTDSGVRFAGAYLLSHGVVKVVLAIAVLRQRLWAYPWMLAFLIGFIGYQLYRIAVDPTAGMVALTCLDVVLTWLTYREWRRHRASG